MVSKRLFIANVCFLASLSQYSLSYKIEFNQIISNTTVWNVMSDWRSFESQLSIIECVLRSALEPSSQAQPQSPTQVSPRARNRAARINFGFWSFMPRGRSTKASSSDDPTGSPSTVPTPTVQGAVRLKTTFSISSAAQLRPHSLPSRIPTFVEVGRSDGLDCRALRIFYRIIITQVGMGTLVQPRVHRL